MKMCKCVKPDLHEVDGYAQCKLCKQWFNHGLWTAHWKEKVDNAIENDSIGRNDPCPCSSGKKYKKCCLKKVPSYRRWIKKNKAPDVVETVKGKGVVSGNETIIERERRIENETNS